MILEAERVPAEGFFSQNILRPGSPPDYLPFDSRATKKHLLTAQLGPRHHLDGCVGRIGANRKGNAHLRQLSTVAPMPNLENLKKQAKQYLRWHRERYYPVAARIRASLPGFRDLSDEQVLNATLKLADAQELVAREQGFESWQALKSGAHSMPHDAETPALRPILNATEAQLFVADIKVSCDFYREKLGFTVAFVYGDPPFYAQVTRDRAVLNLKAVGEPVFAGDIREREGLLSATLTLASADEIKQLYLSYQAAGVRLGQTLKKEPWGARTFVVKDPDGNLILFAGPAD
jgi:uncharacterized glyoxalase superfamily protein PhnB